MLVSGDATVVVRAWVAYQAGHMPEPGGYFDQAAAMLDAFDLCSVVERERRAELESFAGNSGRRGGR